MPVIFREHQTGKCNRGCVEVDEVWVGESWDALVLTASWRQWEDLGFDPSVPGTVGPAGLA